MSKFEPFEYCSDYMEFEDVVKRISGIVGVKATYLPKISEVREEDWYMVHVEPFDIKKHENDYFEDV